MPDQTGSRPVRRFHPDSQELSVRSSVFGSCWLIRPLLELREILHKICSRSLTACLLEQGIPALKGTAASKFSVGVLEASCGTTFWGFCREASTDSSPLGKNEIPSSRYQLLSRLFNLQRRSTGLPVIQSPSLLADSLLQEAFTVGDPPV